jgi:hypothetical protein
MKKVSIICGLALVLGLMACPVFAMSLKFNMCSPPAGGPCPGDPDDTEITIYESDNAQVDVWLVDYTETEMIEGVDYYFYWDTASLSVGTPILGSDWDEDYAFKYDGIYEIGVSSLIGFLPTGGKSLLHTFILHCDAAGDGEISARQGDGGVFGKSGNDWGMDDIYGVVHQLSTQTCCECSLTPGPTTIPRGGTLQFNATVTNPGSVTKTIYFATNVRLPNGSIYPSSGYLFGPLAVTLNPGQSRSGNLTQPIPMSAPLGTYTYYGHVYLPGEGFVGICSFDFNVTATAEMEGSKDWQTGSDEAFAE